MQIKEDLELIEVKRNEKNTILELLFYDKFEGKIYTVKFNKETFNKSSEKFEPDLNKEEHVNKTLEELLNCNFETAENAVGAIKRIYVYDNAERPFCSLYEVDAFVKIDEEFFVKHRKGFEAKIQKIVDTGERIRVIFVLEGKTYSSSNTYNHKLKYSDWLNSQNKFIKNGLLEKQAFENFQKIFGVPFDKKDELIGQKITVFPKKSGKYFYLEFEFGGFTDVN